MAEQGKHTYVSACSRQDVKVILFNVISGAIAPSTTSRLCDHFLSGPPGQPAEAIHEAWTIVAALAASTSRIELGQLVMCVSFRSPALLAKMAVTADSVSDGRLVLGLGAGSYDRECCG